MLTTALLPMSPLELDSALCFLFYQVLVEAAVTLTHQYFSLVSTNIRSSTLFRRECLCCSDYT
jgi:hypothetical protein